MAQRPRLSQLKRTDINYRTFYEQYMELEREAIYYRKPVPTKADLPTLDNRDGDICLVLQNKIIYSWDEGVQNWGPVVGKNYEVPSGTIKRHKQVYKTLGGETSLSLDFRYDVGTEILDVYVNGVLQDEGIDYFEMDEMTIMFAAPLKADLKITCITPYIIGETRNVTDLEKRLSSIEHNHYQLMLTQYYSGKPVSAQGLVFDGFLNTGQIDFTKTTANMVYNAIERSIALATDTVSKFLDVLDTNALTDIATTVRFANSEITLPIETTYTDIFDDTFINRDNIADVSTAFHDLTKELITTDPNYSGGNHYFEGDFMGTTGKVMRVGQSSYVSPYIYSVIPNTRYLITVGNAVSHVYDISNLPSTYSWQGYARGAYYNYNSENDGNTLTRFFYPDYGGSQERFIATVRNSTRTFEVYSLKQVSEGSGRYNQILYVFMYNDNYSFGGLKELPWPKGLPIETGGTASTKYIQQIGSTEDNLIFRIDNILYFIDPKTNSVVRELDFNGAAVVPTLTVINSNQFTSDARYLYFPAHKKKADDLASKYYIEVFDINTGEFVNDYIITEGYPGTTAMAYDWVRKRIILGGNYNYRYDHYKKGKDLYNENTSYAFIDVYEPPQSTEYFLQTKPIYTNLPVIDYRIETDVTLNGGKIEYFIRKNNLSWEKILPNTDYNWVNPKGAIETKIEIQARLRTNIGTSTSPLLNSWKLKVKGFAANGLYVSKTQQMNLINVTGGKVTTNKTVPNETTLQWTVQLDANNAEIVTNETGFFSTPEGFDSSQMVLRGKMKTNNTLMSPVVRNIILDMYKVDAGILESEVYNQQEDIKRAEIWLTTTTNVDYTTLYLSRDGGTTFQACTKTDVINIQDGSKESKWSIEFTGNESIRNQLKLQVKMSGTTEMLQYGIMINPS